MWWTYGDTWKMIFPHKNDFFNFFYLHQIHPRFLLTHYPASIVSSRIINVHQITFSVKSLRVWTLIKITLLVVMTWRVHYFACTEYSEYSEYNTVNTFLFSDNKPTINKMKLITTNIQYYKKNITTLIIGTGITQKAAQWPKQSSRWDPWWKVFASNHI